MRTALTLTAVALITLFAARAPARGAERVAAWPDSGCIGKAEAVTAGRQVALSPDGGRLLLVRGRAGAGRLWLVDLAEGTERLLETGPGDHRDPVWFPDGSHVLFANNRAGSYDLYRVPLAGGSEPVQLTHDPADELAPAVSPVPFSMMGLVTEACGGPYGRRLWRYHKILYERREGETRAVHFLTENGSATGLVRTGCGRPQWSLDGRRILVQCGDGAWLLAGEVLDVSRSLAELARRKEAGEAPDEEVIERVQTELPVNGGADEAGRFDSSLPLPWLFTRYAEEVGRAPDMAGNASLSPNQMVVLGSSATGGVMVQDLSGWAGHPTAGLPEGAASLSWQGDGRRLYFAAPGEAGETIYTAPADCPLAGVLDLRKMPVLHAGGLLKHLVDHGFVALPGRDREFFHLYEKLRYEDRGILVTPDSVLQGFSDVFARLLQEKETEFAATLLAVCETGYARALGRLAEKPGDGTARYLALLFGVPRVLLRAGEGLYDGPDQEDCYVPREEARAAEKAWREAAGQRLAKEVADLDERTRRDVEQGLAWLSQGALERVEAGAVGNPAPLRIDFSQARPRGHYEGPGYRQYFQAMMWLSLVPFPLDRTGLAEAHALFATNATTRFQLDRINELLGATAGAPALPSVVDVAQVAADRPELLDRGTPAQIAEATAAAFGPLQVRTLSAAEGEGATEAFVFPLRLVPDARIIRAVTHPDVPLRGLPTALDVFAALGNPLAIDLAGQPGEERWAASDYEAALAHLLTELPPGPTTWQATLYHDWLDCLRLLSATPGPGRHRPRFQQASAYPARLLGAALAGFAQLKHHFVLYAFQNFGVECGAEERIELFYEVADFPPPPLYVEPHPEFYGRMADLAVRTAHLFGVPGAEPGAFQAPGDEELKGEFLEFYRGHEFEFGAAPIAAFAQTCRRLAQMATDELAGEDLSPRDRAFVRHFGGLLEFFLINTFYSEDGRAGADQGRTERGVTLVTDLFTNVQRRLILHLGIGMPLELVAAVPHQGAEALAVGAAQSIYEFTDRERLTDSQWWQRLQDGKQPPMPAWFAPLVADRVDEGEAKATGDD